MNNPLLVLTLVCIVSLCVVLGLAFALPPSQLLLLDPAQLGWRP